VPRLELQMPVTFFPPKSNRTATIRYSKRLYRQRNRIERVLGHLKFNRAIATRYEYRWFVELGIEVPCAWR
jgi:transposase